MRSNFNRIKIEQEPAVSSAGWEAEIV